MSWTLVETIQKSFPVDDPPSRERALVIAGMVTGWLARVVTEEMALSDEDRAEIWLAIINNAGIEGSGA